MNWGPTQREIFWLSDSCGLTLIWKDLVLFHCSEAQKDRTSRQECSCGALTGHWHTLVHVVNERNIQQKLIIMFIFCLPKAQCSCQRRRLQPHQNLGFGMGQQWNKDQLCRPCTYMLYSKAVDRRYLSICAYTRKDGFLKIHKSRNKYSLLYMYSSICQEGKIKSMNLNSGCILELSVKCLKTSDVDSPWLQTMESRHWYYF